MVYRKRTYRKKPRKAVSVAKTVNRILARRVEDKIHDIFGTDATVAPGYGLYHITALTQGGGDFNRVGNEVNGTYLNAKISVTFPDTTNMVRLLFFYDRQPNGALPVAADLFTYPAAPVQSFLNPDAKRRFRVLKDMLVSGGANGNVAIARTVNINLRRTPTMYKGATDAIGSINTNALYFMAINDSALAPSPNVSYMIRYTYTDM